MRLKDLNYFIEVCQCLSLTKAAEKLGISQTSLRVSIKKLEEEVGIPPFNRCKTGVTLTPGCNKLQNQAKSLCAMWQEVKQSTLYTHQQVIGQLTLGCHPIVAMYHIPCSLPDLLKQHPQLNLKIVHGLSREVNDDIIKGKMDLGIVVNPIRHPDLIIIPIRSDKIGFWCHKKFDKKNMTLLCDHNLNQTSVLVKKMKKKGIKFERLID